MGLRQRHWSTTTLALLHWDKRRVEAEFEFRSREEKVNWPPIAQWK